MRPQYRVVAEFTPEELERVVQALLDTNPDPHSKYDGLSMWWQLRGGAAVIGGKICQSMVYSLYRDQAVWAGGG